MKRIVFVPPHLWKGNVDGYRRSTVLEALVDINVASLARTELDPATLLLVRIAALAAVDAPPVSSA